MSATLNPELALTGTLLWPHVHTGRTQPGLCSWRLCADPGRGWVSARRCVGVVQRVSALAASRSSQGSLYNQQSPGPPELLIQLVCAGVGFIMFWKLLGDAAVLRGLRTPVRGCAVSWDMEGEHPGQAEAFEEAGTVASGGCPQLGTGATATLASRLSLR